MITLIHGDDLEKLEKSIIDLTSGTKVERIDGTKAKIKELEEKILGKSLFGDECIFLIEGLFKSKVKKELIQFIFLHAEDLSIVLIERSKLNKRDLGAYKFNAVIEHTLPQYYFKFLDDFYPGNSKNLEKLYNELLKTMTAEQIYYSLIKRIRSLIAVKTSALSHSEIVRFAPWQIGKLKQQAKFWQEKDLVDFYKKLFEIETKMKSSQMPSALDKYLDMTIITELN